MSDPLVIEHGSSAPGRWLRERRTRIVLWIAVAEGLVVWIAKGAHITTILGLTLAAVLAVFAYGYVSSRSRSELLRQLLWIVAASQILADIVVIGAGAAGM